MNLTIPVSPALSPAFTTINVSKPRHLKHHKLDSSKLAIQWGTGGPRWLRPQAQQDEQRPSPFAPPRGGRKQAAPDEVRSATQRQRTSHHTPQGQSSIPLSKKQKARQIAQMAVPFFAGGGNDGVGSVGRMEGQRILQQLRSGAADQLTNR